MSQTTDKKSIETFKLQHPGTCTGMFWRKDPRPNPPSVAQKGNADWPRNGSILKGYSHLVANEKYLEVTEWKQAGSNEWIRDCQGIWMLFHQEGNVLHPTQ